MKTLILISLLISLTACSQRFDCPYKEGVRCLRLSEVDKRIKGGQLGTSTAFKPLKSLVPQSLPNFPFRTTEEVLTVWVAPYQSQEGTYHEEQRLHFVAKAPQWLNTVNEIEEQDENL